MNFAVAGMRPSLSPEEYPLSHAQRRLWFLEQLHPGHPAYRMIMGVRFRGVLRIPELQAAINAVAARQASLRLRFHVRDGVPVQTVMDPQAVPLPVTDLQGCAAEVREAEMGRLARDEARLPMDLSCSPMFRARLVRFGGDDHVLLLYIHHIVFDAWSGRILLREIAAFYQRACEGGGDTDPGPLSPAYVDYAVSQQEELTSGRLDAARAYWIGHLGRDLPVFELLPDQARTAENFEEARQTLSVTGELRARLKTFAVRHETTVATVLLAAFQTLLLRSSESVTIVLGTFVSGRTRKELEPVIGLFVNELVTRLDVRDDDTFSSLLARTREAMRGALAHQELPLDDLVRSIRPSQQLGAAPLFQVAFNSKPHRDEALGFGEGLVGREFVLDAGGAPFDLTLEIERMGEAIECQFAYDRALFNSRRMKQMTAHFGILLEGILAAPECPVSALPLLSEGELAQFRIWNDTALPFRSEVCIQTLFEEQAARTPDAPAMVGEGCSLTYEALNRRANQLAHHLRSLGAGPEKIVGLFAERSPEAVIGLFAILKAGAAYVPLDPALPQERIALMIQDAGVAIVVAARLPDWDPGGVQFVRPNDEAFVGQSVKNPICNTTSGNLAYVIYTSGSTGRPKGVLIEHRSAINMWTGFEHAILVSAPRRPLRISLDASLSFDASVEQILSLLGGHTLFISPEEVRVDSDATVVYVRRNQLDVIDCVPTQMKLLLDSGLLDSAEWRPGIVLVGGETVDPPTWGKLAQAEGMATFNTYGPTECTVNATWCRITKNAGRPHIGRPLANLQAHVLDRHLQQVPEGVVGELYLGGAGVARGYLNRPELTAQRFIADPFAGQPGSRLYRTGDRVRWADGNLEFLGRADGQVKLRGLRIELGEIEVALAGHPGVREAAVVVREVADMSQLAGYVVARDPASPPDAAELCGLLKETLPAYMVPAAFVVLDALPRLPSGKMDRASLASMAIEIDPSSMDPAKAPRTATEKRLARIWEDLLGRSGIEPADDFFDVGGHSLLAVRMVAEIEKIFEVKIPLSVLVKSSTLEKLAGRIEAGQTHEPSLIVPFNEKGSQPPLFLVTPFHGDALMFRQLSVALGSDQPVYSLQPRPIVGTHCQESVEGVATEMIGMIETVQPQGPWRIGGYCIGGQIALEIGCQWQARGRELAFLGFLDSVRPDSNRGEVADGQAASDETPTPAPVEKPDWRRRRHNLSDKAMKLLMRATFKFCRQTGLRQPGYLGDEDFLERLMASRHRVKTFAGPVYLFRSEHMWPGVPEDLGWGDVIPGGIHYVPVPGDHVAILHRPYVLTLGKKITEVLAALPK